MCSLLTTNYVVAVIPSIIIHLTHANVQESVGKPGSYIQLIKTHEIPYKVLQVMLSVPGTGLCLNMQ